MAVGVFTPYSTVAELFAGSAPAWIQSDLDIQRVRSYTAYEQIYWNAPDVFKLSMRGSNQLPVYVPAGRTICDTIDRYTAQDFTVTMTGPTGTATADSRAAALAIEQLMRRERFRSSFAGSRLYGIMRGDWIWHVTADPDKPAASRISITSLDPGMYFPITDDDDVDTVIGCHIVETITTADGERVRRLTYRKIPQSDGTNRITVEDGVFKIDEWETPGIAPEMIITPVTQMPDEIQAIPVYHIKNTDEPGNPFGSSEMRGLERLMGALNQTISDEDLALALEGIGLYVTDGSEPKDSKTGATVPWRLGPGRVVHTDGTFFRRESGSGGDGYTAHYNRLTTAMREAAGTPDIAVGSVDVTVAESGVALALQLSPLLSKASNKNEIIVDVHNQMFFDLVRMWFTAYEDGTFDEVVPTCTVGSAVPVNRAAKFAELNDMLDRGVIDTVYYRTEAAKLGYTFPDTIGAAADAEFAKRNADPIADRLNAEDDGTAGA
jgi:hypothetical protein